MAMSPQQFCLRWNNHQSNIVSVFEQLLQTEAFVDVTLAAEGMSLKAHKVVLSACSPYFQAILAAHPDKHPIVILKDIRYTDMRDLLDFMYRGEVSVDQDNLASFLRVAESLRIKGLTEVNERKRLDPSSPGTPPYLLQHPYVSGAPCTSSLGDNPPPFGDPPPLKRPMHSPTPSQVIKRRRGRPPKISGEESEGEVGSASATDGEELKSEVDVKEEPPEEHVETNGERKDTQERTGSSPAGPSSESPTKDNARGTSVEETETARTSPGSGVQTEWVPSDCDTEDTNHSSSLHTPVATHAKQAPVSDFDQLYYTKNLLEAAMLKHPYDALKNDKHLQGSILLASLRSPLKFGFHNVYGDRDDLERGLADSSPNSPLASSPPKPSQSSPTSLSPGGGRSNSNHTSPNPNKVSVPIMSFCIQDNGFKCSKCFQTFTHPSNFHRHYITVHTDRRAHKCHVCGKEFKRKDNMMSHIRSVHRPGKEGHTLFREVSSTIPRDVIPPLQESLYQHVDKV